MGERYSLSKYMMVAMVFVMVTEISLSTYITLVSMTGWFGPFFSDKLFEKMKGVIMAIMIL